MTPFSLPWGLTAGPIAFVAVALIAAGAATASRVIAARDRRLTTIDTTSAARFGIGPAWLQLTPWSSVAAGIAVAHLAGPGVPWWLAAALGALAGLLLGLTSERVVVLLALPGAVAMALYLMKGTGCTTGLGGWAVAIVPAAAVAAHVAIGRQDRDVEGPFWWRPEVVAVVALVATQLVVTPTQQLLGLSARPPHVLVVVASAALAAVAIAIGMRYQLALGAASLGVVAVQAIALADAGICRAEPAVMLCSVLGSGAGMYGTTLARSWIR